MLKQSQKRTKRAALTEASMSRQPASSCDASQDRFDDRTRGCTHARHFV